MDKWSIQCKRQNVFKKSTGMTANSLLQLSFKKPSHFCVLIWCERINPQLFERTMEMFLHFPTIYLCEAEFFKYTLMKTAFASDWMQKQMRTQLSSIKQDMKRDFQKCKIMLFFIIIFLKDLVIFKCSSN